MSQVVFVEADGTRHEVEAAEDDNAMSAALDNFVPGINGDCGGELSCATCHVFVDEEWANKLAPLGPDEDSLLEATAIERAVTSRLSCQIRCSADLDGLVLQIPEEQ